MNNKNLKLLTSTEDLIREKLKQTTGSSSKLEGTGFEPAGTITINNTILHTKAIIEKGVKWVFESKVFNVLAMTPVGDYLILFNNGGKLDIANIDKRDVMLYSPIKNIDGLLIPIQLDSLKEQFYIMHASKNPSHNEEVIATIVNNPHDVELWKMLITKYN